MKLSLALFAVAVVLTSSVPAVQPKSPDIAYTFEKGAEHWQIYDYIGGKPKGTSVFYPASWERSGGVNNSGYV